MPTETCEKHDVCMESLRTTINDIKTSQAHTGGVLEGFTKSVNEFVAAIRKDIYSPGGMVEKVGSHGQQIALQWGLMAVIVAAVILQWIFGK